VSDPDWSLRPELVCLTCVPRHRPSAIRAHPELVVIPRSEPVARNHTGHLIIAAQVFVWPEHLR